MLKKLSNFDVFGKRFAFNAYKTSARFTTVIGGLTTIIWVALVSVVSYVIFTEYLNTTLPVVSVNRIRLDRPQKLALREYDIGWVYNFFNGTHFLTTEQVKRYLTFRGRSVRILKNGDLEVEDSKDFEVVPCNQVTDIPSQELMEKGLTKLKSKINLRQTWSNSIICGDINIERRFVDGNKFSLPFEGNKVVLYPCSLPDPTQCASPEELSQLQFGLIQLVQLANYSNKGKPLEPALDIDSIFYVDIATKTEIQNYYKMNYIYDDDIGIVGERLTHKFIDVDKT